MHSAIHKLDTGARVSDLTNAERDVWHRYRRDLRARDPERWRERSREAYRRRMRDPANRAAERARGRARLLQSRTRLPTLALTRASLAARLGVDPETVRLWEQYSTVPRSQDLRRRIVHLLGCWPWPDIPSPDPTP